MTDQSPSLSPFNILGVMRLKRTIQEDPEVLKFISPRLSVDDYEEFVSCLQTVLPHAVSHSAVYESLLHLVDRPLTMEGLSKVAWRLSGNLARLRKSVTVPLWASQYDEEWMPTQIVEANIGRDYKGSPGATFSLRILAGTAAGLIADKFWTSRFCGFLSRSMGFTRSFGKHPYQDMMELVGLRLYGLFVPEHSEGRPGFDRVKVTPSLFDHNKNILRMRLRDDFSCPMDFPLTRLCHKCHIGYDQCPAAVHPRTFERSYCYNCESHQSFDPENKRECVECSRRRKMLPKQKD